MSSRNEGFHGVQPRTNHRNGAAKVEHVKISTSTFCGEFRDKFLAKKLCSGEHFRELVRFAAALGEHVLELLLFERRASFANHLDEFFIPFRRMLILK